VLPKYLFSQLNRSDESPRIGGEPRDGCPDAFGVDFRKPFERERLECLSANLVVLSDLPTGSGECSMSVLVPRHSCPNPGPRGDVRGVTGILHGKAGTLEHPNVQANVLESRPSLSSSQLDACRPILLLATCNKRKRGAGWAASREAQAVGCRGAALTKGGLGKRFRTSSGIV